MSAIDLSGMSDKELRLTLDAIVREQAVRRRLDASPEKIENAIAEYQQATGRGEGEQWEQPTGPLNAYRKGAVVEHEGEEWVSTHANNTALPGISGWRLRPLLDDEGNEIPPPYVQPAGNHDSYQEGERITHNGQVWEAVRSGVVHSPDEYAPDWILVEEEPEPEPEPPEDDEPVEPTDPEEPEPGDGEGDEDDEPTEPEQEPGTIDNPLVWSGDALDYEVDQYVVYDGTVYRIQQAHTSAAHWLPPHLPALYERSG